MTSRTDRDERDSIWDGFWADVRRDYAAIWPEFLATLRQVREEHWDLVAEMRANKQFTRRMKQRITGVDNPTRRQWRAACKALDAEARERRQSQGSGGKP
jgi:hypothetical protein